MAKDGVNHPLTAKEATRRIQEMAQDPNVARTFSGHARQRMREREIHADWVDYVLRKGCVDEVREENETWRYRVAFVDNWGRTAVVTAIPSHDNLVIVTVTRSE